VKILVCIKQVPQKDAPLKLNEAGTWIREDVSYEVNEPDAFALEEALRQKEKHTGEVVVITAGPARALQVLREALAKGADRAIHLEDDAFVGLDAYNTARAIAAAIKDEKFDLIFTGLQFWRRFWDGRTRRSLCRSKKMPQASASSANWRPDSFSLWT
jgi:electron transfer flavoprotein beta subunit